MQLEQMKYLVEIAKYQSLTEASKNLHLSQQALSSSMIKLETELGYTVLLRNTKGVRLTEKGEILAKGFNRLIHELEYLLLEAQDGQMSINKKVVCILTHGIMEAFFADLSEQLADDTVFEALEITEGEEETVLRQVLEKTADIGLVTYNNYESSEWLMNEQLLFTPLFSSRLYVRVPRKMSLSNLQSVSLKSLSKENIIVYQPKHWKRENALCKTIRHFCPGCCFSYEESYLLHLQKVKKGLGIAFTVQDGPFVKHYDEKWGFYLIPVKESFRNTIGTLSLRENTSPVVWYWINYLQIACANHDSE